MKMKTLVIWGSLTCLQKVRKEEMVSRINKLQRRKKAPEKRSKQTFYYKILFCFKTYLAGHFNLFPG